MRADNVRAELSCCSDLLLLIALRQRRHMKIERAIPCDARDEAKGNNCLAIAAAPVARMRSLRTLAYRRSGSNWSTIRNNTAATKQIAKE